MAFPQVSVDMNVDMQEVMATLSNDTVAGPCKPEIPWNAMKFWVSVDILQSV